VRVLSSPVVRSMTRPFRGLVMAQTLSSTYYFSRTFEIPPIFHTRGDCPIGSSIPTSKRVRTSMFPVGRAQCSECNSLSKRSRPIWHRR